MFAFRTYRRCNAALMFAIWGPGFIASSCAGRSLRPSVCVCVCLCVCHNVWCGAQAEVDTRILELEKLKRSSNADNQEAQQLQRQVSTQHRKLSTIRWPHPPAGHLAQHQAWAAPTPAP